MVKTNCAYIENEIEDIVRLFKNRPNEIEHAFRKEGEVFHNAFLVDGEQFVFEDRLQVCDELLIKRYERRFSKLHLYEILSAKYGERMPWGALTGIRPTKLAYMELEDGRDFVPLFENMHVERENIALVADILSTQKGIYEKQDGNTDLFVSLPFCPTKCAYCSFITAPIDKTRQFMPEYLDCLDRELQDAKQYVKRLRSIYIGGGTPFALSVAELERVMKALTPYAGGVEYTVEAGRPDVFDEDKLKLIKDYGATRICINPQTFSDETLVKIGRKHTVAQFYEAYEQAQKYGFSVNIDLIAGLEGESVQTFTTGVERATKLGADNITVHCLSLKSGAKLKEEISYIENDSVSDMVASSRAVLRSAGYLPYYMYRQKYQAGNNENVGWTKPSRACVYNIDVMEEVADNLAVGANAISKRVFNAEGRIERLASQKDLRTYIDNIDATITKKQKFFE